MIYSNDCFKCPCRVSDIEPEEEKAKEFYRKYGAAWRFNCGASYYPPLINKLGVEINSINCHLKSDMSSVINIIEKTSIRSATRAK